MNTRARVTPPIGEYEEDDGAVTRTIMAPRSRQEPVALPHEPQPRSAKDPAYIDLTDSMPSKFMFYPFDTLSIRPFTWGELKKMYKAVVTKDFNTLAEAVNSTIDRNVFELTVGDFWFVMYWLRMNSFKKAPFTVKWSCHDENHHLRVRMGELETSTLSNDHVASMSNVKVLFADPTPIADLVALAKEEHGIHLYPATVADMVGTAKMLDNVEDAGELWLSKYASNINRQYGNTLPDRMKYLEENDISPDFGSCVDEFIVVANHGIIETVTVNCKGCGAPAEITVSVDALSFFPSI